MPRKNSKNYFTKETEEYIVKYNNSTDVQERDKIFSEHLYYPFYKLAENIIHTFKFYNTDVDQIEDLKLDIISMVVQEKISKFDPSRGAKAYSYFGTIIKRWLIAYNTKNYNRKKNLVPLADYHEKVIEDVRVETAPTLTLSGFIDNWVADVYFNLDTLFAKDLDRRIVDAVLTVFRTRRDLEIFQKKAFYAYIREITRCDTLYLTKVLTRLKKNFYDKYYQYLDKGMISVEFSGN